MANLQELEEDYKERTNPNGGEEILEEQDMSEALAILKKCRSIFHVLSDKGLVSAVSHRERKWMAAMVSTIDGFVDDVGQHYQEDATEEEEGEF